MRSQRAPKTVCWEIDPPAPSTWTTLKIRPIGVCALNASPRIPPGGLLTEDSFSGQCWGGVGFREEMMAGAFFLFYFP